MLIMRNGTFKRKCRFLGWLPTEMLKLMARRNNLMRKPRTTQNPQASYQYRQFKK